MTTNIQELIAGDFIKNLLQNLPKEETTPIQKKEDFKTQKYNDSLDKIFLSNSTITKLKDLKYIIKGSNSKELLPNDTINNCLIYPSLLNTSLLVEKIFSIFEVKSINEIYLNLIQAFNAVYFKEKNKEKFISSNDSFNKNQLFEIVQELNFFISPSVIYVSDPLINKLSFDIFISHILNDNKITKNILEAFINIFNIRHLITDYFVWNKDKLLKVIFINLNCYL